MFNVIGIIARPDRKRALEFAVGLSKHLEERGLKIFLGHHGGGRRHHPSGMPPLFQLRECEYACSERDASSFLLVGEYLARYPF